MYFKSARDFEGWLMKNHDSSPGIWVKIAKKHSRLPAPTYDEALKTALCFGWIVNYEKLNSTNRYTIYYRIQDAKRQETKDRRIRDFVDMLAHGQTTF